MIHIQHLYNNAKEILQSCFKDKVSFPIDVKAVAERLGIRISCIPMAGLSNENIRRVNSKIMQMSIFKNPFSGKREVELNVDSGIPLASKRFAIAYGIAEYILHPDEKDLFITYEVMPLCPKNESVLSAEILALFLLMPADIVLTELQEYLKERAELQERLTKREAQNFLPVSTEKWVKYLSERAGVTEYHAILGYQYARELSCYISKNEWKEISYESTKISE